MARIPIFDLDGTLIDSAPDICAALNHVRNKRGLESLLLDEVRPMIGGGLRQLLRQSGTINDELGMETARAAFVRHYGAHLLHETKPYPGVTAMIDGHERAAVVTNKPRRFGAPIIDAFKWSFELVVYGDDGYGRKPDASPLIYAMETLDIDPMSAVYIGDTAIDVQAGLAAGVETWLVPWADIRVDSANRLQNWGELDGILGKRPS